MFHMCKRLLLARPSISEIVFLMFVWTLTERRALLDVAGEGLGWGEGVWVAALQSHLPLELQSQLMGTAIPSVVTDNWF